MKGFPNFGNTCYFNSVLQCLMHVPVLTNILLRANCEKTSEFIQLYQAMVINYWTQEKLNPELVLKLLTEFRKNFPQFQNISQHDCQEALVCILDLLDRQVGSPLIRDIFHGEMARETICKSGTSTQSEEFSTLLLTPNEDSTMEKLLKDFRKWDVLTDYVDDKEVKHPVATTRNVFKILPNILLVSFKMYTKKCKITLEETFEKYSLFGTCVHKGSVRGGHYVAYTKFDNQWYLHDDDQTVKVDFPATDYHYVAFYALKS